jgi:predicted aspartyl protease
VILFDPPAADVIARGPSAEYGTAVGITTIRARVMRPTPRPAEGREEEFIVDSGAIYAIVPARVLRQLGIRPDHRETFTLADGSHATRPVGFAMFEIDDRRGVSKVIFGAAGDATILGAVTLEELGLMLDPLRRELRPIPMLLL